MKQFFYLSAAAGILAVSLASCIDDNYDLSDIDTTSEFKLVDLTLPLNVSQVRLDEIIKPDAGSALKTVTIGGKEMYAVVQSGTFESQSLRISDIHASVPRISAAYVDFELVGVSGTFNFELKDVAPQSLNYTADNVDDYIVGLDAMYMEEEPSVLKMAVSPEGGAAAGLTYELSDLRIKMPLGLQVANLAGGYEYNPETGMLKIDRLECPGGKGSISLNVTGMKMSDDTSFVGNKLVYKSSILFESAKLTVRSNGNITVPEHMRFAIDSSLSALHITSFSGTVRYDLTGEGLDIPPVSLTDIPDFLSQDNTHLRLANPQLYVGADDNPVAEYDLNFSTGLRLTKVYGENRTGYEPERRIETSTQKYGDGPYNFVLSPVSPATVPDGYAENLEHIPFCGMSDVLDGPGLPDHIDIELLNPVIPEHHVDHFRLKEYNALKGKYEFLAPLAFKTEGTVIEYSDTFDDWGSEDLDKLTLKAITLDADALSTLPLDAELHITPLAGQPIDDLQVSKVTLAASPDVQHVTLEVKGTIRQLKGIKISATVRPGSEDVIAPDQTITLTNLRARVTGSYITDF